jgi:hypothetical protein
MENNMSQETLYSLLELLYPKKEMDGSYSRKYETDASIVDFVALRLCDIYNNSNEEDKLMIYVLLNFRVKELYCQSKEYEKAISFNKPFFKDFIAYLENNEMSDHEIPIIIYEAFVQLKINSHIEKSLFNVLDKLFLSDELFNKTELGMSLGYFKINDLDITFYLNTEEFISVYIYYVREVKKENDLLKTENSISFLFERILDWASGFSIKFFEESYQEIGQLVIDIGYSVEKNNNYFICFVLHYLNVEILQLEFSEKYDEEEGSFVNLNKNELKTLTERLRKFICHILLIDKDFIDVGSKYYIKVCDIVKYYSCYHNSENIFVNAFIEQISDNSPVEELLDLVVKENVDTLFANKKYRLIVDYYLRNKDNDYNLFEIAYSLYEQKCLDEEQKCLDESKTIYETIIDNGNGTEAVYNNLSLIYEKQGDLYKAQELLNFALKIEKNDKIALNNLNRINDKIMKQNQVQQIRNTYSKSVPSLEFEKLPFRTKIYLGSVCRELLSEDLHEIRANIDAKNLIAPSEKLLEIVYDDLISNRAISVSPRSLIDAFPQNNSFPSTFYTYKVMYNLNLPLPPNKKDLIDKILNPKYYSNEFSEDAYNLWKEIAVEECIEYLLYQLNLVGFQSFKPGEKTNIMINTLLETFSVGQVYGIIYKSVANASKMYLEKNMPKAQAANSVIGGCQRLGENARINNWDMTQYSRIKELPQSVLSEFFFNKLLLIGNDGFTKPPKRIDLLKNG